MFTWECPTCGNELDLAETECPNCSGKETAAGSKTSQRPSSAAAEHLPPVSKAATKPPASSPSWGMQPKHLWIFAAVLVIVVAVAVYLARPGFFGGRAGLQLESVPTASEETGAEEPAALRDLEVAGIRTWYDGDYKPKVRAVVVNHGDNTKENLNLQVHLRPIQADRRASPLASFDIRLDGKLGPRESRDIETDLIAMGTLQSLPRWNELRIDVEAR